MPPSVPTAQGPRSRRGPGRLNAEEAAALPDRLIAAAQDVFMELGFARATMDGIAVRAGASRKTIYARWATKEQVFAAVVQKLLQTALDAPRPQPSDKGASARSVLTGLAQRIAAGAAQAGALNRLILAEAHQFPEIAMSAARLQEVAVTAIRQTLEQLEAHGELPGLGDAQRSAQIFLEMTVSIQRRDAMLGLPTPRAESDQIIDAAVTIFLDGCGRDRRQTAPEAVA